MSDKYAWIIDTVNVAELGDDMADEVGTMGPRDMDVKLLDQKGHTFRMLDDDGIWYYRGRIVVAGGGEPWLYNSRSRGYEVEPGERHIAVVPWDEEAAFGPLSDFGAPNAGCTEIQYRIATEDGERVWATL
jgi:hypothetical protein